MDKKFPTQQVLELACAAQRFNGAYIKDPEPVYSDEGVFLYSKHTNKMIMLCTLDHKVWTADPKDAPMPLKISAEDTALAAEIQSYFKRLLFAAIDGSNEFQTEVNALLNSEEIPINRFGFIACLPSVYARDRSQNEVKKAARQAQEGYLGEEGDRLMDLDCEILEVVKSKNFEGWNICAIINDKMASWMSQTELKRGPCVIVKAKVKAQGKHWKHGKDETRLNYVKAAQ